MPIEPLNIPDAKDLFTWLPSSDRIICTHPSNPCILNTMIEMIGNAQDNVLLCNWMLLMRRLSQPWPELRVG